MLERFTRSYPGSFSHPTLLRHDGTLIAFALTASRTIAYATLGLSSAPETQQSQAAPPPTLDVDAWPAGMRELLFASEIAEVGFGVADQRRMPVFKPGAALPEPAGTILPPPSPDTLTKFDYARSTTARLTAAAPFQVLSDGGFVYVLRQALAAPAPDDDTAEGRTLRRGMVYVDALGRTVVSPDGSRAAMVRVTDAGAERVYELRGAALALTDPQAGEPTPLVDSTLLVDRFVLVGAELQPKVEVRFQRSRSKNRPASRKDGLGAADLDGNTFFEPTQELRFVGGLTGGHFTALILPTQVAEVRRWQLFAHNARSGMVDSINVERSADGLFNTRGSQIYTCTDHPEVFSNRAGRCVEPALADPSEPCDKQLIPRVVTAGHAESALDLTSTGAHVALSEPIALGREWTVELWVFPRQQERDEQTPLEQDRRTLIDGGADGLTVAVDLQLRLHISLGAGAARTTLSPSRRILSADAWQHLAISCDGATLRLFSGGRLRERIALPAPADPTLVRGVGASGRSFAGVLDELRLWDRRRGEREIQSDRSQRLTGLEPGLAAYLRLDEGSGAPDADGDLVYDQVRGATGVISGARWVTSDAPLGENPGVARDSFRVAQHGGGDLRVSAGLSALLYFQQHSEVPSGYDGKKKRLKDSARVMLALGTSGGERPLIAALDLGVTASGRVAMLPDRLELPVLDSRLGAGQTVNQRLDIAASLEQLVRALLETVRQAERDHAARLAELAPLPDPAGLSVVGRGPGGAFALSDGEVIERTPDQLSAISVPAGMRATLRIRAIALGLPATREITGPAELTDLSALGTLPLITELEIAAAVSQSAKDAFSAATQRAAQAAAELASARQRLADAQAELAEQEAVLSAGAQVEMPLAHIDAQGQTIAGGLLGFAWTESPPLLFDSAAGNLALYFRGADDQLFAAYYSTFTQRARYTLRDAAGRPALQLMARGAESELDRIEIAVAGDDASPTCTLTLRGAGIEETWREIPRDPARMAPILNGTAAVRSFLGRGSLSGGARPTLTMPDGVKPGLEAGATLMVGDTRVRTKAAVAATSGPVTFDVEAPRAASGPLPVYAVAYDYDRLAETTRVPADLYNGSLLLVALADAGGPVAVGQTVTSGATLHSTWSAAAPGSTLAFDGAQLHAAAANPERLAADDDLTLEAWVRPGPFPASARLITQRSVGSAYALGLRRRDLPSALRLDGINDSVELPKNAALNPAGSLTLEAWVKLEAADRTRTIISRGDPSHTDEIFLRLENGHYQIGRFVLGRGNSLAQLAIPPADALGRDWVHLAGVYDAERQTWSLYRNGELAATDDAPETLPQIDRPWRIGATVDNQRMHKGGIDEVRLWKRARSQREIQTDRLRRLAGNETDLVGYWHFDRLKANDSGRHGLHGTILGSPTQIVSPLPAFAPFAAVGAQAAETADALTGSQWRHVAASYDQSYAAQLAGGLLNCGNDETLNLDRDLTIEVALKLDSLGGQDVVLSKGQIGSASGNVPYTLAIGSDGRIILGFEDVDGIAHTFASSATISTRFHTIAVTRQRVDEQGQPTSRDEEFTGADGQKLTVSVTSTPRRTFHKVSFFIDGAPAGVALYGALAFLAGLSPTKDIGRNSAPLLIGADRTEGGSLRGAVSEVRLWNTARPDTAIWKELRGDEEGLVSWWRFEEGRGTVAEDSKARNHGVFKGDVRWIKDPNPAGSTLRLFVDGAPVKLSPLAPPSYGDEQFALGALLTSGAAGERYEGELEEVRVWRVARTHEQIQDTMFQRIEGAGEELLATYTFDAEPDGRVTDRSGRGLDLALTGQAAYVLSTAPVGEDAPQVRSALAGVRTPFNALGQSALAVQEYADLQLDARGNLAGVLKRSYAFVQGGALRLVTGYKVGDMTAEWVGQIQFKPQLVGYIEGAPPAPSENLTQSGVSLPGDIDDYNEATTVELVEADAVTHSFAASRESSFDMEVELGARFGLKSESEVGLLAISQIEESKVLIGAKASFELSLAQLDEAGTTTAMTTGRSTSLELRGRYATPDEIAREGLGRRFIPDNMGLALVKSRTADVFALRLARNGALIAYQTRPNPDIPEDFNLISFPINPRYTKQGTLDGKIGLQPDVDYPDALTYSPDSSYFKPIEAYAIKNRIAREELEIRTRFAQFNAAELGQRVGGGLHSGRVLDHLPRLGKRNLVNTYVWTSDGGLFAESQESLDTVTESVSGSYQFKGMAGLSLDLGLSIFKVAAEVNLSAMFGGHLNISATKSAEASRSFSLNVGLDRVERDIYQRTLGGEVVLDTTDPQRPRPIRVPGKVDAYRFMSFYLEPQPDNADLFFNRVVDPIWLAQSSDPNAAALRQAHDPSSKPACWRVMHRVTFVSRVLPRLGDAPPATLEQTLQTLDVDSNFELIKLLDPFVSDQLDSFSGFAEAVRRELRARLPELLPHADEVVRFMAAFYGIEQGHELAGAEDRFGETTLAERAEDQPPVVSAGLDQIVGLDGAAVEAELDAAVLDDRFSDPQQLFVTWELASGPADVTFADRHALKTRASFRRRGRYVLRLTASDGRLAGSDELAVVVNTRPVVSAGPDMDLGGTSGALAGALIDDGLGDPSAGAVTFEWRKVGTPASVTFADRTAPASGVTFGERGSYLLRLTASNGTFEADDEVLVTVAARATRGLEALYTFQEGAGALAHDVSGAEPPLDLALPAAAQEGWLPDALRLAAPTALASGPAARLAAAIQLSGELTIEAWLRPDRAFHDGMARIVTLTDGPGSRGFVLGQAHGGFIGGVRTSASNANATSRAISAGTVTPGALTHLALTRDAAGASRLYIDGALAAERRDDGRIAGWAPEMRLAVGGEPSQPESAGSSWAGALHLAAVYNRALSAEEVRQNFSMGADADLPPVVFAGADRAVNWPHPLPIEVALSGRVTHDRATPRGSAAWLQVAGPGAPGGVAFEDERDPQTRARFASEGRYVLRLSADDGERAASDEVTLVISRPPLVAVSDLGALALTGAAATARLSATVTERGLGDPAGTLGVRWRRVSGPTSAVIADPSAPETDVTFSERGVYRFEIVATVSAASGDLESRAQVEVAVHQQPRVSAGPDRVVSLPPVALPVGQPVAALQVGGEVATIAAPAQGGAAGVLVRLAGAVTDTGLGGPSGSVMTVWTGPAGVSFDDPADLGTLARLPAASGVYTLTLSASNGTLSHTDQLQVTVNRPPVVDAGDDLTVKIEDAALLQATAYDDGLPLTPGALALSWRVASGPGQATFSPPDGDVASARFSRPGVYQLEFAADDGAARSSDTVQVTVTAPPRVTAGLLSLYTFAAADVTAGASVLDIRDAVGGLNLRVEDRNAVQVRPGALVAGLQSTIRSTAAAAAIARAVAGPQGSRAVTLEVWLRPAASQRDQGPQRILTISQGERESNITLAQDGRGYLARFRAAGPGAALRSVTAAGQVDSARPTHLVFTLDTGAGGDRTPRLFVNGAAAAIDRPGALDAGVALGGWDERFVLALANEVGASRSWEGEIYLAAIYGRALSAEEVRQNFLASVGTVG